MSRWYPNTETEEHTLFFTDEKFNIYFISVHKILRTLENSLPNIVSVIMIKKLILFQLKLVEKISISSVKEDQN